MSPGGTTGVWSFGWLRFIKGGGEQEACLGFLKGNKVASTFSQHLGDLGVWVRAGRVALVISRACAPSPRSPQCFPE